MGFNSAFKGLKLLKTRERAFEQFNDPVLNVLNHPLVKTYLIPAEFLQVVKTLNL